MTDQSTRVVHVNDHVEGAVYIGRRNKRRSLDASPFANPFKIGKRYDGKPANRGEVLLMYADYLRSYPELMARVVELRGKPLACWCRRDGEPKTIDNVCHGDVLISILRSNTDDELRATGGAS